MAHTPGPWTTDDGMNLTGQGGVLIGELNPFVDECDDNARLIAAAPDLLAALESVLPFVPPPSRASGTGKGWVGEKARAALAAAKGE